MSPTRKKTAKKKAAVSGTKKKAAASGTKKKAAADGTKKKAAARASAKSSAAKAKPSRKKAVAPKVAKAEKAAPKKKAPAKQAAAAKVVPKKKKPAKKTAAAKAGAQAIGKKEAAKPSAPHETVQQKVVARESKRGAAVEKQAAVPKKRVPRGKSIPLSEVSHPKFGLKFECFQCQAKFYDLNKPEPLCPKCGADQRDRPRMVIGRPPVTARKRRARPMVPLLDDEEETPTEAEARQRVTPSTGDDMFDDAAAASIDEEEVFESEEVAPVKPVSSEDPDK